VASIHWTLDAQEDLRQIVLYVGRDSATYAAALAGRILATVDVLRRHPKLGRVVPEYGDETLREVIVSSYRVVHRVRGRRIGIVAVVHGSRDLLRRLPPEPWDFG
jgi:plasmid stabilization system protein ParE